jgi:hypothetical protein
MGKVNNVKKGKGGGVLKAVGKAALKRVPGVGAAIDIIGAARGAKSGGANGGGKRSFSIARYQKRLIAAKINARIKKIQMSPYKGL